MQPMLSGVAVRGRIWHAAHALAVARGKSVLSSLWRKNQVDYYGEPRNSGRLFFQTPKRAHFLTSGRKKWKVVVAVVGTKTDSCASKSGPNMWCFDQFTSKCGSRQTGVHFFDIATSKSACFGHFDFQICFAPQRHAIFDLPSPDGSAPAALVSLLFDPPEPQSIRKTQFFATLPFCAP